MFSMITKLALSSESGWGTAFRVNGGVEVCQQSLFWLVCKGIAFEREDLKLSYVLGSEVILCQFETRVLIELLKKIIFIIFKTIVKFDGCCPAMYQQSSMRSGRIV